MLKISAQLFNTNVDLHESVFFSEHSVYSNAEQHQINTLQKKQK